MSNKKKQPSQVIGNYSKKLLQKTVTKLIEKVKELEQAQSAEDVSGFMALFDENAVWVNGAGTRLIGKKAIENFTKEVLPGAFSDGSSATYEIEHTMVLSPDLVLTAVRQTYFDHKGKVTSKGSPTYIWKQNDKQWPIISGQNTIVKN